ncbi:MAG: C39 family peptidase, partial [Prevotellaceae bacterium]|nr:C39 family peptidase [Prevotellaceae bacterium]
DATLIAHELAHGAFVLWHTFSSEQFIAPQGATSNLMDYNNGAELWKHQWQLISDPQRLWFKSWQDEEEGEMVSGPYAEKNILDFLNAIRKINYSDTIKIYDKSISCPDGCVASNLKLGEKILSEIRLTTNTASPITDEYVFIKASEQFIKSCEECIDDSYAKLVFTDHHSEKYPVSTGLERVSIIVKRVELPVLQNYLYTEKQIEQEIMVENISWVSQKDESLFGKCTGCWTSSCCRRAAEYMMGNTSMANCADSAIAVSAPYMTTSGNITTAYFNDNISAYTLATYNSAALNYNAAKTNEAVEYVKSRLKSNRPVLIGVHYVNKKLDPPNNINRATRHFMVIIGYVKEKNGTEYFLFYDPGRLMDDQADATSPNNKFIINLQQGSIQGNYDDKIYTITEIIKTN